jgi:hypothetical protein
VFYDHYARTIKEMAHHDYYKYYQTAAANTMPNIFDQMDQRNKYFTSTYWERALHLAILIDLLDQRIINLEKLDTEIFIPRELTG